MPMFRGLCPGVAFDGGIVSLKTIFILNNFIRIMSSTYKYIYTFVALSYVNQCLKKMQNYLYRRLFLVNEYSSIIKEKK